MSFGVRKIPGALSPMGTSITLPWANDRGVAHLQAKTVESAYWLLGYGIGKNPWGLITPMSMPITPQWSKNHDLAFLQTKTVSMNLIWSESAHWLLGYGIRRIPGALIKIMGMSIMSLWANNRQICTPTGQDGSYELDLE